MSQFTGQWEKSKGRPCLLHKGIRVKLLVCVGLLGKRVRFKVSTVLVHCRKE